MKACILMIEDDREMVTLGKLILEREGYQFVSAFNGHDGLKILTDHKPGISLVLLDIMLPQMYGWEVLERIKADEITKHIPVIMLTARHYLAVRQPVSSVNWFHRSSPVSGRTE
jgi:CheY-like chemotaxis protein